MSSNGTTSTNRKAWPASIQSNISILTDDEQQLVDLLIDNGQEHLFSQWAPPGQDDDRKHDFFRQISALHSSYLPEQGGLTAYIRNARQLLTNSKNGVNPLTGWRPEVPTGISIEPISSKYSVYDSLGKAEIGRVGFVLVAGGLGERLGYNGIKIELPPEMTTGTSYIEYYCQQILAIQGRYCCDGGNKSEIPLAIMVSDDTEEKTRLLLAENSNFGLSTNQITIMKQEKVAALMDNDARIALENGDPYTVCSKPHGHGDVHALMHRTGTAQRWFSRGVKWCFFFQDTNGLALNTLSAMLGVSMDHSLDVNSRTVPRYAKQAVGAIVRLINDLTMDDITVNVEYNQLDPLLRATISPDGDVNDPNTGRSIYPGNINQLLFRLDSYVEVLQRTHGVMGEFVNPKYADTSKTTFKKPTRLECMMQDYPKVLGKGARVGFTDSPGWCCYSPVKNNTKDAAESVAKGVPAGCAMTGESDQYNMWVNMLRLMGSTIESAPSITVKGITCSLAPQIVFHPSFAVFPSELQGRIASPENVVISKRSTLIVEGNVLIESLNLDGALRICNQSDRLLTISLDCHTPIRNSGHVVVVDDSCDANESEVIQMRGYKIVKLEQCFIHVPENASGNMVFTHECLRSPSKSNVKAITMRFCGNN